MKQTRTIPFRGLVIFFTILAVCYISGRFAWMQPQYTLGYFTLAKNAWGTALFQDGLHTSFQINGFTPSSTQGTTTTLIRNSGTPTTIDFGRDDIIFDHEGNLYTESKENAVTTISDITGKPLVKTQTPDRLSVVVPSFFYLINPNIPGMLAVHILSSDQVIVNLERKTITIPATVTTIVIHVYTKVPSLQTNL